MRPLFAAAALAAVLASGPAAAGETVLALPGGLAATLNLPAGDGPRPAVLMLHGFGSSRDEVGGMYARTAAALAEAGIASLRIDFRGFGKSDGDTGAHTVERQNEDAAVALAALAATAGVDPGRIGVLGFSFGGGAAIQLAAAAPQTVRALAVWSSVGDYAGDFSGGIWDAAAERARAEGVVGLDLGWRTIVLRRDFFESLARHDLMADLGRYPGPVLIVTGTDDYLHHRAAPMAAAAAGRAETLAIEGADHIFHVFDPAAPQAGQAIAGTVAWFVGLL